MKIIIKQRRTTLLSTILIAILAIFSLTPKALYAAEISYSGAIPSQQTDWQKFIALQKFDPALGTLQRVEFSLTGALTGQARFENQDPIPHTITVSMGVVIQLARPNGTVINQADPKVELVSHVSAFDGQLDFAGTSGKSYPQLAALKVAESMVLTKSADLALFIGAIGNPAFISLPVIADSNTVSAGGGNLAISYRTAAEAAVTVRYIYKIADTPTPTRVNTQIATPTATRAATSTSTLTPTPTRTATSTRTAIPTPSPTATITKMATSTNTQTPTNTATATLTSSHTPTVVPTTTLTPSPTSSSTQTISATATPTATSSQSPTIVPKTTPTGSPTSSPTASPTQTMSPTVTSTGTQMPTSTATATLTSSHTPTFVPTTTPTPSPTPSPTLTATSSQTSTRTPTITPTSLQTPTIVPTATPTKDTTKWQATATADPFGLCTYTIGFWKAHPKEWPITSLTIGGVIYNAEQLLAILRNDTQTDVTYLVAKQLVAAKLNIARGVSEHWLGSDLAAAESWLSFWKLGKHPLPESAANEGRYYAEELTRFNKGQLGPKLCQDPYFPE